MAFTLTSPAFGAGGDIPRAFTCDGDNTAPPLAWSEPPRDTRSFALIMDDPDAPRGTFTHWVLFDIPAERAEMSGGGRSGAVGISGTNSRSTQGYMGPCPPSGTHRYFFRLFALDVKTLGLPPGASRQQIEDAIRMHTIGTAELMGRYRRSTHA